MKILFVLLFATALHFINCTTMPGGQRPFNASLNDDTVVFAVNEINKLFQTNGDTRPRFAVEIISATTQLVSGVIYRYKIKISGGTTNEVCKVSVWSRPWLPDPEKTILQGTPFCEAEAESVPLLVGGQETTTLSNPDVQKAVAFLENTINARSNSLYYLKARSATSVTKQVVNGVIYQFNDLEFADSDCRKNDALNPNKVCLVSANATPYETCTYGVYWNPRETPEYTIISSHCGTK